MIIESQHNNFRVKLEINYYKESEIEIITNAVKHMTMAMGDPYFEFFCREYEYKIEKNTGFWFWKKTSYEYYKGFYKSEGLTGYQIYTRLLQGKEILSNDMDYESDIYLKIDRTYNPGVIGYTYPDTKWQWIYQRILDDWDYQDIAGNFAHEWCHKMGFSHESNYTEQRRHSVPYAVGYYVRDF